ncbi:MAG: amino acid adenylation domain-containing protein, partial [Bacteroidota bacterium]
DLNIWHKSEQQSILNYAMGERVTFPVDQSIGSLFSQQALIHPDRPALRCGDRAYSYQRLDELTNRLAHYLKDHFGLGPERVVGICMERSDWYVISLLSVLKTGAAFAPIATDLPAARRTYILSETEAALVLTEAEGLEAEVPVLCLPTTQSEWMNTSAQPIALDGNTTQLSYILYTSGSTGKPKGAMIEQGGMLNHLYAKIRQLQMDESSVVGLTASISFDISIWQALSALLVGGCTQVYRQETVLSPRNLAEAVAADGLTILELVPSYLTELMQIWEQESLISWTTLKFLLVTGETLPKQLTARWFKLYNNIPLVNAYGPTEASDDITHALITNTPESESTPIGKPVENLNVYVLDEQLNLCPIGVKGEICVGGIGVGRGYLKDADKTNAVFVQDPFGEAGARMYKTGDIGRYNSNGELLFYGRKDVQVKVRGYRIELGEIEEALTKIEGVHQAAVLLKSVETNSDFLQAFVVFAKGISTNEASLQNTLGEELPSYMIPSGFTFLPEMPLTANGKIDRKALDQIKLQSEDDVQLEEASCEEEAELAGMWANVLGMENVPLHKSFFELGGHSLQLMRVQSLIRQRWNVDISFLDFVVKYKTVRQQWNFLQSQEAEEQQSIEKIAVAEDYALSPAQHRLWAITELDPDQKAYHLNGAFRLNGKLNFDKLQEAFWMLEDRHESLRTNFIKKDGTPRQMIHPQGSHRTKISFEDFRSVEQAEEICLRAIEHENHRAFDLAEEALQRLFIWQLADEKYVLFLSLHHIISDALSLQVFIRELGVQYAALVKGETVALDTLPVQYRDYASWMNSRLANGSFEEAEAYWKRKFYGDIPVLELPTDFTRPALQTYNGAMEAMPFPSDLAAQFRALTTAQQATAFNLLVASVKAYLYRITGQSDVVVGFPIAGRSHSDLEGQIGFYTNTLALRTQINKEDNLLQLLQRIKRNTSESYEFQDYPFDRLIDLLDIERDISRSPIFNVWVQFIELDVNAKAALSLDQLEISNMELPVTASKFDLSFYLEETPNGYDLKLEYNTDLFKSSTI